MDDKAEKELREKLEMLKRQQKRSEGHEPAAREDGGAAHAGSEAQLHEHQAKHVSPLDNRYLFLALFILILAIAVVLRVGMLKYSGFFEPDGFYHYSVITQAVENNYIIPNVSVFSGFPSHYRVTEPEGFYYVTIIPYMLLRYFGIGYYTIMRLVPILFGMLDAIGAYFLSRELSRSRVLGLLAMTFVAISSGDIARTAALVYRGDGFVTIFLITSLLLALKSVNAKKGMHKYYYAIASGVVLAVGITVWNGAPFAIVVYIVTLAVMLVYSFTKAELDLVYSTVVLTLALLLTYTLERLFILANVIRGVPALGSYHFFVFYAPLLLGGLLVFYILKNSSRLFVIAGSPYRRAGFVLAILVVFIVVLFAGAPKYVSYLASGGGGVIASGALYTTIQELQKPTLSFIWASFSYQVILAPLGIIMFLAFRKRLYNAGHNMSAARSATLGFIAIASYFALTTYLQINAIRYNSLVSVPFAILSAYAVYSVLSATYRKTRMAPVMAMLAAFVAVFYIAVLVSKNGIVSALVAYSVFFLGSIAYVFGIEKDPERKKIMNMIFLLLVGLFAIIITLNFVQTYIQSFTSVQADDINSQFLAAMQWMRNNTPANATVLALWPDGSVVEGWAHRQSLVDSVGGQNEVQIYNMSRFLFNESTDYAYLEKINRPQYIVVRNYWFAELSGIAIEGNITNSTAYGYDTMSSLHVQSLANSTEYIFNSSSYPYYSVDLVAAPSHNGSTQFSAYLGSVAQRGVALIKNIVLVNQSSGGYALYTSNSTAAINYTFMMDYQENSITGGTILGPKMLGSNMFKLIVLCNTLECPYNDANVTMQLVYRNNDTKIFHIEYS
jgi:asparagine N-glycosylation enzyme membrane subunit Stt3